MDDNNSLVTKAELFGAIFILAQHLTRLADSDLEHLALTTKQWLLIMVLEKHFPHQDPTLSEAAQRYGSSRQNVKQIALQLEERGYLQLIPDQLDRRALRLKLTDKASVFSEPQEVARQIDFLNTLFRGMEVEEIESLRTLIFSWLRKVAPAVFPNP